MRRKLIEQEHGDEDHDEDRADVAVVVNVVATFELLADATSADDADDGQPR
jgi:hypothetical protein